MKYKIGDKGFITGTNVKATIVGIMGDSYALKVSKCNLVTYWKEDDFRLETNEEWIESLTTNKKALETVRIIELIQKDFLQSAPDYEGQQIWQAYEEWLKQPHKEKV